ncbi:sodium:calcium antiporter [Haloplanus sp. C73]|uniref:sodium:calcium antiporter n=1 Tax=Haloplanus sp. C73 TaxID=3421641 RepID=UPI003EB825C4
MLGDALALLVGLALLLYGADRVVKSVVAIAGAFGVPTLLVGGTLVAVGSSLPEITTALYAGVYGAGDFVVGHIIGSATSQITLGVGVVALLSPLQLRREKVTVYGVAMIAAMSLMLLGVRSGTITRLEGGLLVAAYLVFVGIRLRDDDHVGAVERHRDDDRSLGRAALWVVLGFAFVAVGGHLLVVNSRSLAVALAVPEYLIGLVTGLGTTAPEIVIAALAVGRGEGDIAIGTLFGSNVTDPLFSLGLGALVDGYAIDHVGATMASGTYMLGVAALVVLLFYVNGGISRRAAVGCIALYGPTYLL